MTTNQTPDPTEETTANKLETLADDIDDYSLYCLVIGMFLAGVILIMGIFATEDGSDADLIVATIAIMLLFITGFCVTLLTTLSNYFRTMSEKETSDV